MTKDTVSCGVLLFQQGARPTFLVLYRKDGSPDLPKGRREKGESDVEAALRELLEETGIPPTRVQLTDGFIYENTYRTKSKKTREPVRKTVRVFHGVIDGPVVVEVIDHVDYAWVPLYEPAPPSFGHAPAFRDNPTILGALHAWTSHLQEH